MQELSVMMDNIGAESGNRDVSEKKSEKSGSPVMTKKIKEKYKS